MENANSPEYLEKIKNAVIENLKKTIPAPSVQMQDVPRQGMNVMTDEDDAALDDEDEDNNKDVRLTQRGFDKRVVADNEFEESDDEEMAEANGVYQKTSKRKGIQDYKNPFAQDDYDPTTAQNGNKQPTPEPEAQDNVANDVGDETMEDVDAEVHDNNEAEKEAVVEPAPQAASADVVAPVDKDGDVDMAEAVEPAEPEAVPSIKQEETEAQPASAAAEPAPTPEKEKEKENEKEKEKGDDEPTAEVANDDATAEATVEEANDRVVATPPAGEAKEGTEKIPEEQVDSSAKPTEVPEDNSTKMDVEDTAKVGGKETEAEAPSGETTEETVAKS